MTCDVLAFGEHIYDLRPLSQFSSQIKLVALKRAVYGENFNGFSTAYPDRRQVLSSWRILTNLRGLLLGFRVFLSIRRHSFGC